MDDFQCAGGLNTITSGLIVGEATSVRPRVLYEIG